MDREDLKRQRQALICSLATTKDKGRVLNAINEIDAKLRAIRHRYSQEWNEKFIETSKALGLFDKIVKVSKGSVEVVKWKL